MANLNIYVGIPYKRGGFTMRGADCWGLCLMVMRKVFDTNINIFEGHKEQGSELEAIILGELKTGNWIQGPAHEGMICLMYSKSGSHPDHIGICSDARNVLHSFGGNKTGNSAISSISTLQRMFSKMEFYSYAA